MTFLFKILFVNYFFFFLLLFVLLTLYYIVVAKNPINIIVLLISFFLEIGALLIVCGADYLGILIMMLYAGAISIILLFVVMLLDMKDLVLRKERVAPLIKFVLVCFFYCFGLEALRRVYYGSFELTPRLCTFEYREWGRIFYYKSNIEVIGANLYEFFLLHFIAIGGLLALVMIYIISLILNYNLVTKKQRVDVQAKRSDDLYFGFF